jgi:hypothetical protein
LKAWLREGAQALKITPKDALKVHYLILNYILNGFKTYG